MVILISLVVVLLVTAIIFMQQPQFGKMPSGERLERIKRSPHYKNGSFQNISVTPALTEGTSYYKVMREFFFGKRPNRKPLTDLPNVKTDLHALDKNENVLVWFGHSSYFMQIDGKKILVDPVLSGAASPIPSTTRSFAGTDIYTPSDIPEIDFFFITHDHWDHLDYKTIKALKPKIKTIICSLGTGAHFERWGFDKNSIIEKDWNEEASLGDGFRAHTTTARHFSGRGFSRNKALWTSYVLKTPTHNIFIGGDSGYDKHFAEIGKKFGPFDLAILENGQYDNSWKYIHMLPEEVIQAGKELGAKKIFPVHSAKFALGNHPWNEPLNRVTAANEKEKLDIITPMIGEPVRLKDNAQVFTQWWKNIQ